MSDPTSSGASAPDDAVRDEPTSAGGPASVDTASVQAEVADRAAATARTPLWQTIALLVVFAALGGYDVFEAIGNLVALPQLYAAIGLAAVPWVPLVAGVALPPVAFALALVVARRMTLAGRATVLLVSLAASNALYLGLVAYVEYVALPQAILAL